MVPPARTTPVPLGAASLQSLLQPPGPDQQPAAAGKRDRRGRVKAGGGSPGDQTPDCGQPGRSREVGRAAVCGRSGYAPCGPRPSPRPAALWAAAGAAGPGGPWGSCHHLRKRPWLGLALPGQPDRAPEPLLEAASWVLAGAGAAGREAGRERWMQGPSQSAARRQLRKPPVFTFLLKEIVGVSLPRALSWDTGPPEVGPSPPKVRQPVLSRFWFDMRPG
nr:collagen alpha-1(II) chain [Oryctolagus cuniculus]